MLQSLLDTAAVGSWLMRIWHTCAHRCSTVDLGYKCRLAHQLIANTHAHRVTTVTVETSAVADIEKWTSHSSTETEKKKRLHTLWVRSGK